MTPNIRTKIGNSPVEKRREIYAAIEMILVQRRDLNPVRINFRKTSFHPTESVPPLWFLEFIFTLTDSRDQHLILAAS